MYNTIRNETVNHAQVTAADDSRNGIVFGVFTPIVLTTYIHSLERNEDIYTPCKPKILASNHVLYLSWKIVIPPLPLWHSDRLSNAIIIYFARFCILTSFTLCRYVYINVCVCVSLLSSFLFRRLVWWECVFAYLSFRRDGRS